MAIRIGQKGTAANSFYTSYGSYFLPTYRRSDLKSMYKDNAAYCKMQTF